MKRLGTRLKMIAALCFMVTGCGGYRAVRDVTPDVEQARRDYVSLNPESSYNDDILDGRVRKGMSRLQVRIAWGEPDQVNYGLPGNEVWSYSEPELARGASVYNLLFEDEHLSAVDVQHAGESLTNQEREPAPKVEATPPVKTSLKPEGGL